MNDQPDSSRSETQGDDLPEQLRVRRDKRQRILDSGEPAYPTTVERTHTIRQIRETYDGQELEPDTQTGSSNALARLDKWRL